MGKIRLYLLRNLSYFLIGVLETFITGKGRFSAILVQVESVEPTPAVV